MKDLLRELLPLPPGCIAPGDRPCGVIALSDLEQGRGRRTPPVAGGGDGWGGEASAGEGRREETDAQTDGPGRQLGQPNEFPSPAPRQVGK